MSCSIVKYAWLVSLAVFFLPLRTVLVRFDHLVLPNGKNIHLFFEVHDPITDRDRRQLEVLSKILKNRRGNSPMHLMVEVPSLLAQERAQCAKVTHNIIDRVENCPLIVAEDIEIRCVALASYFLLGKTTENDNEDCTQYNAGLRFVTMGDITIDMLLTELNTQKTEICSDLDTIPFIILADFYRPKYEKIIQCETGLHDCLQAVDARPEERIIELIKKNSDSTEQVELLGRLRNIISDCAAHLVDLHMVRKILKSECDNCTLIVGREHAEWICAAMEQLGARYLMTEGDGVSPLEDKSFNVVQSSLLSFLTPAFQLHS